MGRSALRRAEWVIQYYDGIAWSTMMEHAQHSKHYPWGISMRPRTLHRVMGLLKDYVECSVPVKDGSGIHGHRRQWRLLNVFTLETLPSEGLGF